jgi:hypothetical protein
MADAKSGTVRLLQLRCPFLLWKSPTADPKGRAVSGSDLRPLACWNCGFYSRREHKCLCVVNVEECEVQVSAVGRSLVHRSPTECGVSVCDLETSTVKPPRPKQGSNAAEKIKNNSYKWVTTVHTYFGRLQTCRIKLCSHQDSSNACSVAGNWLPSNYQHTLRNIL